MTTSYPNKRPLKCFLRKKCNIDLSVDLRRSSRKFIQKVNSNMSIADKTALKLEKNRESARKARQRKNLYIKLL